MSAPVTANGVIPHQKIRRLGNLGHVWSQVAGGDDQALTDSFQFA
jgi:hypothetical protein